MIENVCTKCGKRGTKNGTVTTEKGTAQLYFCQKDNHRWRTYNVPSLTDDYPLERRGKVARPLFKVSDTSLLQVLALMALGLSIHETANLTRYSGMLITRIIWWFYRWRKDEGFRSKILAALRKAYGAADWHWGLRDLRTTLDMAVKVRGYLHAKQRLEQYDEDLQEYAHTLVEISEGMQSKGTLVEGLKRPEMQILPLKATIEKLKKALDELRNFQHEGLLPHGKHGADYFLRVRAFDPFLRADLVDRVRMIEKIAGAQVALTKKGHFTLKR